MRRFFRSAVAVLKGTMHAVSEDRAASMAAALAYYTFFSIAPLLLVAIAIAGVLFGREAAQGELSRQMSGLIGESTAESIEAMVQSASGKKRGTLAAVLGVAATLFGATGVFAQLQESLNVIWKAPKLKLNGILAFLRARLVSLSVVLGMGFLLLVSLLASVALNTVCELLGRCDEGLGMFFNELVFFGITALLFALIFKLLPDVKIPWGNVWLGATITAAMFSVGKHLLGLILSRQSFTTYGTAASLAAFLLWVYYSSLILFLGAELTHQVAVRNDEKKVGRVPLHTSRPRVGPAGTPLAQG